MLSNQIGYPTLIHKNVLIINKLGLHARAAAKLVNLASRFHAEIQLKRDHKVVNCKSIMGVMLLAAAQGTELELICTGEDEQEAMTAIEQLIMNKFDEE